MILFAVLLFLFGMVMSAFFSGSETGMYRVSRTRLVLDGLAGSRSARVMIWILNRPFLFVATSLVGNNIANFLTSLAIVMAVGSLFGDSSAAELIGPMLMTPFIFVFGELLPKHWFFQAPYRLLKIVQPMVLLTTLLFLPLSMLLGVLAIALGALTGQTPFRMRVAMARSELTQLFRAGQEAGIIHSGQLSLAGKLFDVGNELAISFAVPMERLATVDLPIDKKIAVATARRQNHPIVLVRRKKRVVGYLRYSELATGNEPVEIRPVIRVTMSDRHLPTLLQMYDAASEVALICDEKNKARYVVTRRQLLVPMNK